MDDVFAAIMGGLIDDEDEDEVDENDPLAEVDILEKIHGSMKHLAGDAQLLGAVGNSLPLNEQNVLKSLVYGQ